MKRKASLKKRIMLAVFLVSVALSVLAALAALLLFALALPERRMFAVMVVVGIFVSTAALSLPFSYIAARRLCLPIDPASKETGVRYVELSPLYELLKKQDAAIEKQLLSARRRQEEFRVLSENMDEGLVVVDRHGKVVSANAVARAFMEEGSEGDAITEILAVAGGGRHTERSVVHEGRYYRIIGSPVLQSETIVGAVALLLDETEKRSMEQYRKEFTANVSHELKTPLTSISGFAELLENGMVAPDDVRDFGADIHAEAKRLLTLVNDIIRLSRLEDGSRPYESCEVDLYVTAEEALSTVRPAAERAGITLSLEGTHETVMGVEPILYDVVYNLCDNAVKYNREGGFVRVYVGEGETGTVLTVEDGGIGIPPEHIDRIFERFYRVDKSHSKEIGGTGLGLSIVRHGVAYHDGEVQLTSTLGAGTKVTVILKK